MWTVNISLLLRGFLYLALVFSFSLVSLPEVEGRQVRSSSKSKRVRARLLLRKGNRLFAKGRYQEAYSYFQKGHRLSSFPSFYRSMALCAMKLSHYEEAHKLLTDYLKRYPKAKDRKKLEEVALQLKAILATRLTIKTEPPGALVFVDVEVEGARGKTPFDGHIAPGKHTIILKKKGFGVTTVDLNIEEGQSRALDVPLVVPLKMKGSPAHMRVGLVKEGSVRQVALPFDGGAPPGDYELKFEAQGFESQSRRLTLKPAQGVTRLSVTLLPTLRIESNPPGAKVSINGDVQRKVTPFSIGLKKGHYQLTLEKPSFSKETHLVEVKARKEGNLFSRTLSGGLLSLKTGLPGSIVYVDGDSYGEAPLMAIRVPLGIHEVTIKHPDRRPWSRTIDFKGQEQVDIDVELGRPHWPLWTAAAVTAAGVALGLGTGIAAVNRANDLNSRQAFLADGTEIKGWCSSTGTAVSGAFKDQAGTTPIDAGDCGAGLQHAANAGFIVAGTAALTGTLYYFLWAKEKTKTRVLPLSERKN